MFKNFRTAIAVIPLVLALGLVGCEESSSSSSGSSSSGGGSPITGGSGITPGGNTGTNTGSTGNNTGSTGNNTGSTGQGNNSNNTGSTASGTVFVTDGANDAVVEINQATNAVVNTIPVGSYPTDCAYNDAGTKAYVSCIGDNSLWVVDTTTGTATSVDLRPNFFGNIASFLSFLDTVIGYGTLPTSVDVHTTATGVDKVYVTCLLFTAQYDGLSGSIDYIIDNSFSTLFSNLGNWALNSVLNWIGLGGSTSNITSALSNPINGLGAAKVACGSQYTYITNLVTSNVTVLESDTGDQVDTVDTGILPLGVAVTSWGEAYVGCIADNSVYAVLPNQTAYQLPITGGFGPINITADDGNYAYAACLFSGSVEKLDYNGSAGTIQTGGSPLNLNSLTGLGNGGLGSIFPSTGAGATVGGILTMLLGGNSTGGSSNTLLNTVLNLITGGSTVTNGISGALSSLFSGGQNGGINGFLTSVINLVLGQLGAGSASSLVTGAFTGFGVCGLDVDGAGTHLYTSNFITGDGSSVDIGSGQVDNASGVVSAGYNNVDMP